MAKKKTTAETAPSETAATEKITKSDAVRHALAAGVDNPSKGVEYIRSKFGIEMTNQQFSTVKFQEGKKKGVTGKRGRRPAAASSGHAVGNGRASGSPAELASAVKKLVGVYGATAVTEMVQVFAE